MTPPPVSDPIFLQTVLYESKPVCMDGWMDAWMDGCVVGCLGGWVAGWIDRWLDGWMDCFLSGRYLDALVDKYAADETYWRMQSHTIRPQTVPPKDL